MSIETAAVVVAKWLWESYGKDVADNTIDKVKDKWSQFKWQEAEEKYRARLRNFCSTVRVLGNPKPINLDEIFTDVYVLDKPTAFQRFDIQELQTRHKDIDILQISSEKRKPALNLALKNKRLFILGKPGAGKTTFLKYLALNAIDGKLPKTPVFVSLREWADTNLELLDFIVLQFETCSFPDPKAFILNLLSNGNALILFDGLDEVNIEGNQRSQMISTLTSFAKRYENVHICLTCRIAATDYSFDQFTYLEIADFDKKQQERFISKWYQDDKKNLKRFLVEFKKPESMGLRDLARTPLLLTLLCLAFDETLSFPSRRVDLYKESIDALLKKWDSSRGIKRDEFYRKLSPARKEQMLARIAAENFETGNYFVVQEKIEKQITKYLQQLPDTEDNRPEGDVVLQAMEAQHGILVERAHNIYSFSHLTFQEYLTTRYIVENAADGTIDRLITQHFEDDRWREVFLLTASLLDNADKFFDIFLNEMQKILPKKKELSTFFSWALEKAKPASENIDIQKRLPTMIILELVLLFWDDLSIRKSDFGKHGNKPDEPQYAIESKNRHFGVLFSAEDPLPFSFHTVIFLMNQLSEDKKYKEKTNRIENAKNEISQKEGLKILLKTIGVKLSSQDLKIKKDIKKEDLVIIQKYLKAYELFLSCLRLASVADRKNIENKLLLTLPAG